MLSNYQIRVRTAREHRRYINQPLYHDVDVESVSNGDSGPHAGMQFIFCSQQSATHSTLCTPSSGPAKSTEGDGNGNERVASCNPSRHPILHVVPRSQHRVVSLATRPYCGCTSSRSAGGYGGITKWLDLLNLHVLDQRIKGVECPIFYGLCLLNS